MPKNDGEKFDERLMINFLKKNKNFFIKYPNLIKGLKFPSKNKGSDKVIDLDAYRFKKISQENIDLQNQITDILLAGKSHITAQKRVLKSTLRILKSRTLSKLVNTIVNDLRDILDCDIVNCFTSNSTLNLENLNQIDSKILQSYFKNKTPTNLNQNPKGILIFFPNKRNIIKSYLLLKVLLGENYLVVAMGSKSENKFTPSMKVDLVEFLIQIIEIKLENLKLA